MSKLLPETFFCRNITIFPRSSLLRTVVLTAFFFTANALLAWSGPGHRIVAALAWSLLSPKAQTETHALLKGKTMVSVAGWADWIREKRRDTASFHHVDIPLESHEYILARDESDGPSVIATIDLFSKTIADQSKSEKERHEALKFLIHFVGDLHQPLHCATNHDHGGNGTIVTWGSEKMNLHHFWDYNMVALSGLNELQYVNRLKERLKLENLANLQEGTPESWALESHQDAVDSVYTFSPNLVIDDAYVQKNLPIVETRLLKAGVRLAKLLNAIWP